MGAERVPRTSFKTHTQQNKNDIRDIARITKPSQSPYAVLKKISESMDLRLRSKGAIFPNWIEISDPFTNVFWNTVLLGLRNAASLQNNISLVVACLIITPSPLCQFSRYQIVSNYWECINLFRRRC